MMKKFLLSVCVCFLFTVCVCAKTIYGNKYIKGDGVVTNGQQQSKEKEWKGYIPAQKKTKESKNFGILDLNKAKQFYINGDFDNAQSYIKSILSMKPDNEKANDLMDKILLLKEEESFYKKTLVDSYYVELRKAVRESNLYEGFYFIKKIKSLDSKASLTSFNNELTNAKELLLYTFDGEKDKNIFINSIDAFLNEEYKKSLRLVYKLYRKYPNFRDFVSVCRVYAFKENSKERAKFLYNKAIKCFRANRLGDAKNYAEMAYYLQQDNVKLRLLVKQIDMEGLI